MFTRYRGHLMYASRSCSSYLPTSHLPPFTPCLSPFHLAAASTADQGCGRGLAFKNSKEFALQRRESESESASYNSIGPCLPSSPLGPRKVVKYWCFWRTPGGLGDVGFGGDSGLGDLVSTPPIAIIVGHRPVSGQLAARDWTRAGWQPAETGRTQSRDTVIARKHNVCIRYKYAVRS